MIAATRVPLRTVLASLDEGEGLEQILVACPTLAEDDVRAVIATETGATRERVRDDREQIHRLDLRTRDGAVRMVTELSADQRKALKTLGIPPPRQVREAVLNPVRA